MSETKHLIVDSGSAVCKAGFSGDDEPSSVFSTIVGRPIDQNDDNDDHYIGNEAQIRRDVLSLTYPIELGVVQNWDDMEMIWRYIFEHELKISPEEHAILLTETPLRPKANREKITEVMFETYNTPSMFLANQAVLSAYAAGKLHCVVLDSGDGVTNVVPVFEGSPILHAITNFPLAGSDLTTYLLNMLSKKCDNFKSNTQQEVVREMKEKFCYVAMYPDEAIDENSFELPDGQLVVVGQEKYLCPEALFRPSYLGYDDNGVHNVVYESIMHCSIDMRKNMYSNIVLSGGTTKLPGFGDRLEKEMSTLVPATVNAKVCYQRHQYSTWSGGSMLASMLNFQNAWITREEYNESGATIIHKKC